MWRVNIHLTLHICCVAVNLEDTHFICLFQTAEAGVYHLYQNFKMCFTQTDSLVSFKFCSLNVNLGSRLLFYDAVNTMTNSPRHGSVLGQVVNLSRVQEILELSVNPTGVNPKRGNIRNNQTTNRTFDSSITDQRWRIKGATNFTVVYK